MGKIAVLDDNMINMIAAGEVIERPASVVKELLENSIDAGAGKITVEIEDGGRAMIRVIDDGGGMDAGDLALAFEPHATSKIRTSEDLGGIRTMGFRGEALASVGSVAKVTIISRMADSIGAHRIEIDCGQKSEVRPCSGDVGTTIEVRNLFYKLPARRKFLRTPATEMSHITEHFSRIGLAHNSLDLTLRHNGKEVHRLLSGQGVAERIAVLFGEALASDLLETSRAERGMQIQAFLAKPFAARASSKYQYLFLNRRFIRDKFILHAVREAYRGLMEPSKYPVVFLFMQMPPENYDVNVHPTKVEVRFDNSNLVHSEVLAVLRDKLLSTNLDVGGMVPRGDFSADESLDLSTVFESDSRKERIQQAMKDFFDKPASAQPQRTFSFKPTHSGPKPSAGSPVGVPLPDMPDFQPESVSENWLVKEFLQVHNSYILLQSEEGFVVIDQHALHERILYEQMCRRLREGTLVSQRLLMPHSFEVTNAQLEVYEGQKDLFEKLGIELEPFGPNTLAVQAFPALLEKAEPVEFVKEMLDKLVEEGGQADEERLLHEILDMAACKAAIKAGQALSAEEIAKLLKDKDIVQRTSRCPHGRPTTITFSLKELEKQFKRTGF
ncbi:MAG: DNA mismatch repair endonuclease MutL [Phycisphaerae bacterium]|nr:DNA mismatch repair endonuclease MutL [Phycisphaerae bacterium]